MKVLYISGSPRKRSNTDYLINLAQAKTGGKILKLSDFNIKPCNACWACVSKGECVINDDMSARIIPLLLESDGIILGSPVFFNSVSAQLKAFIDRTWCIKGLLTNKVGGTIVVGRKYGAEGAVACINAFFLKHEMIVANRGVTGLAFAQEEIKQDQEAIHAVYHLTDRILELGSIFSENVVSFDTV